MPSEKKWELLSEEDLSPSKWFPLFRHKVKLPNGHILDDYYISKLGDVAMILPITEDGDFIFVRQYKHGIQEITLEFPSGMVDHGCTPLSAAYTEMEQRTGVKANNIVLLAELRAMPSKNSSKLFCFIAKDAKIIEKPKAAAFEGIELVTLSARQVEEKVISGEINCSDTVALYTIFKLKSAHW
ncbi:MAG TPA: NUDIX hydrolase [Bacteroidia bacterium]|jgi:8-oxo-dGTP pyrophosphatase MutT (NUDIX family)